MSKNIFLFNKIGAQNQMEVNDLQVNQQLKLTGADPDCLLKTDSNSNVVTFTNGPARYLIEVDGTSLKPEWTNSIKVDEIETNTIKINNTTQADILVIGDNLGNVERLVRGPNNYILCSDDNTFGLNYKSIYDLISLPTGQVFADQNGRFFTDRFFADQQIATTTITGTGLTILKQNNVPLVAGRNYKLTYNYQLQQPDGQTVFIAEISGIGQVKSYTNSSLSGIDTIVHYFTANNTGLIQIRLQGIHVPSTNSYCFCGNIVFIVEPLGI